MTPVQATNNAFNTVFNALPDGVKTLAALVILIFAGAAAWKYMSGGNVGDDVALIKADVGVIKNQQAITNGLIITMQSTEMNHEERLEKLEEMGDTNQGLIEQLREQMRTKSERLKWLEDRLMRNNGFRGPHENQDALAGA